MNKWLVIETTDGENEFMHFIQLKGEGADFTKEINELCEHLNTFKNQVPTRCYSTNETPPTNWG